MEPNTIGTLSQFDDIKVQFIGPIVTVDSDKLDRVSRTIAQRFSGILYTLLSSLLFTTSIFVTKQLNVELLDALFFRCFLQSTMLFVYMKFVKHYILYQNSTNQERWLLFTNAFFSTTGFLAFLLGYRYLPLPDLTTIRYTQVIWIALIASVIYHEKPSIPIILAMLLTIVGVVCVAQPNFLFTKTSKTIKSTLSDDDRRQRLIGLIIALYASVAMSIMIISNKMLYLKHQTKHSLIIFQFAFLSLCGISCYLFHKFYFTTNKIQFLKDEYLNWRYFCASAACLLQILASVLIQKAVKREHPSVFTIVQSSDILFAILLQNLFSSIKSNFLSLFGSILVLTSILIISAAKLIKEKQTEQSTVALHREI